MGRVEMGEYRRYQRNGVGIVKNDLKQMQRKQVFQKFSYLDDLDIFDVFMLLVQLFSFFDKLYFVENFKYMSLFQLKNNCECFNFVKRKV